MALIKCSECGNEISDKAAACPKCGAPAPGAPAKAPAPAPAPAAPVKKPPTQYGCGSLILLLLIGGAVFSSFLDRRAPTASQSAVNAPPSPEQQLREAARAALALAERAVRAGLKDPESAKFGKLIAVKTEAGGVLVCGDVNARNSFGAYGGSKKFMWSLSVTVLEESMPAREFAKAWNATCAKWPTIVSK